MCICIYVYILPRVKYLEYTFKIFSIDYTDFVRKVKVNWLRFSSREKILAIKKMEKLSFTEK